MKYILAIALLFQSNQGFAFTSSIEGLEEEVVADGLNLPSSLAFAPDGRLFIGQQDGVLRVVKEGVLLEKPFLKVDAHPEGEHGLLGIAFDPKFQENHFVYIYYTAMQPTIHNRVSRFVADGDVVQPGSEKVILELDPTDGSIFHSAGMIRFRKDGTLYIGVGDNANRGNAQLLTRRFGKILRINPDGSIPQDNPFLKETTGPNQAIWAYGLRNPHTFSFHPLTDRMFINDVGDEELEEINEGLPGANYGWPSAIGYSTDPKFVSPLHVYSHLEQGGALHNCAISGGAFYSPQSSSYPPEFKERYGNHYFFIDYCANWIRAMNITTREVSEFGSELAPNPVGLEVGPDGNFYYFSRWFNGVYRIVLSP